MNLKISKLPKNFLVGTGTSAFQCEGGKTENDWQEWIREGKMPPINEAADFWNKYREWIDKAAQVGNAFRLSIEWGRIEPEEGKYDAAAIQHYREILWYCKLKGLTTIVTLHHFTSPVWLAKQGGWTNPKVAMHFYWYAATCAHYFGDEVDYWLTINEPQIYVGSRLGAWPEKYSLTTALTVLFKIMVSAHNMAYRAIHEIIPDAKVGSAQNMQFFTGKGVGKIISPVANTVWNFGFLNCTIDTHDFIGINYYGTINFPLEKPKDVLSNLRPNAAGLKHMLKKLHKKYAKPIMITENGVTSPEGLSDDMRYDFILEHLSMINETIESGVSCIGYLHWSLMDNYELGSGYNVFMGLFTRDGRAKNSAKSMMNLLSGFQPR